MRGFTQPLAVVVGLLVCIMIGYAIVRSFAPRHAEVVVVEEGERLDAPLANDIVSEEPPAREAIRPNLPDEATLAQPTSEEELAGGHMLISFAKLANYRYIYPDVEDPNPPEDQIPEAVQKLDGEKVAIRGFIQPMSQKDGKLTEFLLMRDQSYCCFGVWPGMNEWIHVTLKEGETAPMVLDLPTTVFGTLEVGEVYEKGVLMSIYRMRFDKLIEPER